MARCVLHRNTFHLYNNIYNTGNILKIFWRHLSDITLSLNKMTVILKISPKFFMKIIYRNVNFLELYPVH